MPAQVDHYSKILPFEAKVLDLWESGMTVERIAAQLGRRTQVICDAIGEATGGTDHLKFQRMVRAGTIQLGAAIRAYQAARA